MACFIKTNFTNVNGGPMNKGLMQVRVCETEN